MGRHKHQHTCRQRFTLKSAHLLCLLCWKCRERSRGPAALRLDGYLGTMGLSTKGYRCIMVAWPAGKQLFLQSAFARSDRKFNTREVNRSSTVASDRSGNERAVNVAKRAGVLNGRMRVPMSLQTFGLLGDFRLIACTNQYFSSGALERCL